MKIAFQIVSVLPFAALVSAQEDGFIPNPDYCGKDRCVKITPKPPLFAGQPYQASAIELYNDDASRGAVNTCGATSCETLDYDKYFDFIDYDILCLTCIVESPGTSVGTTNQPIEYQRNDENCRNLAPPTADSTSYTGRLAGLTKYTWTANNDVAWTANTLVTYRMFKADFFQDSDSSAAEVKTGYYKSNYCINNVPDYVDPCCLDSVAPSSQPSKAPSSAPSIAPTTSAPKKDPCFSSMSTVFVQEKGRTSMANVEVGDVVLTMDGFEKIYTIDHRNENIATDFVQIVTETDNAIELTSKHLIYLHDKHDPVEAGTVKVGDKLLTGTLDAAAVSKVNIVTRNGLFNPITSSGTLVVDGIATSTYTAIDVTGGSAYLTIGGFKILSIHDFLHLAMGPFKVLCMNVPESISSSFCLIEEGEEHNVYNKIGLRLLSFGKNQNINVQSAIVMSLVSLFVGVSLFFNPIVVMISLLYTVKTFQKTKNL